MKTTLTAAMLAAFLPALSASAAPPVPDADAAHSAAAPAQPDPAVLAQLAAIAAFFASPTGAKFNALLSDAAFRDELQLALAFIAGPGSPP